MDIKSLTVIRTAIWSAKDIIEELACEDYPHTPFKDEDLSDIFYQLNSMGIALTEKMESMELRDESRIQEEMKMKFIVNGHEVEFTACTAISASIGDTERQNALFVHDCDDEFGNGDSVIFGVDMPETDEEAAALMCEPADSYQETLDTVEF